MMARKKGSGKHRKPERASRNQGARKAGMRKSRRRIKDDSGRRVVRYRSPDSLSLQTIMIVIFCVALLTVGAVLLFFAEYVIYKVYDVRMEVEVSDTTGFNVDDDYLNFGKATPLNSNTRTMVISHSYDRPLRVHFKKSGNISAFIRMPDDFYLEPEELREVGFTAVIPRDAQEGEYVGTLKVYFRRI